MFLCFRCILQVEPPLHWPVSINCLNNSMLDTILYTGIISCWLICQEDIMKCCLHF